MRVLAQLVRKELLVLLRDWHALLLLFVMPAFFILVMSVALRDRFAAHGGAPLTFHLVGHDRSEAADTVAAEIRNNGSFRDLGPGDEAQLLDDARRDKVQFVVVIPDGFGEAITTSSPRPVRISAGPGTDPAAAKLFGLAVERAVGRMRAARATAVLSAQLELLGLPAKFDSAFVMPAGAVFVEQRSLYLAGQQELQPSSVQQSVPAWLVFAMFFVALPLSTTWVNERAQGTLARLRSIGLSPATLLIGKLLPYAVINLVQVVLMLGVGVYIVPLFGGDALSLGSSATGLAIMAVAVSFAAVSYALLVANIVRTTEQATILAGVSNLLLAALGGVFVPRFVMPAAMQRVSAFSPMAWGLEGFLDCLLRGGTASTVVPHALLLFGFGAASLLVAGVLLGRTRGM